MPKPALSGPRRAFIFDIDGTLLDNMSWHDESWLALFIDEGVEVDATTFISSTAGMKAEEVVRRHFGDHLSDSEVSALMEKKEFLYRTLARQRLKPLRGVRRFLERAHRLGIAMAVATSASPRNRDLILDGLELRHFFAAQACGHDVKRGKPEPDVFLLAAERLGVPASACVVFEDATVGIEAARRAGMSAVALTTLKPADTFAEFPNLLAVGRDFADWKPEQFCITRDRS